MTRPASPSAPSHVLFVRHGARLDMADSTWSHSSPTPYDTPLTYGGWTQSRSTGVRIASLLPKDSSPRIIIHSSPFLRCVQTAVSIASGIAQHHHQQATNAHYPSSPPPEHKCTFRKPLLRVDAWLSEWMNTDYYLEVSPPPPSPLLIATSKSEYLRSGGSCMMADHFKPSAAFVPPSPGYALSIADPIPPPYVSHAKDYVALDWAWDSTLLGDGPELGEEWGAMHKRFRRGYKRLLQHYASLPPAADETVIILVTHGAGCNALLGAMTEKPVLIDIAIGSMTMGVRSSSPPTKADDVPAKYDLRVVASTSHAKPTSPASSLTPPLSPELAAAGNGPLIRSVSTSNSVRPSLGLWSRPTVVVESAVSPTLSGKPMPFLDKDREPLVLPPPEVEVDLELERKSPKLENKGLWTAKGWGRTQTKRRWTVGREPDMSL